jgi:hypothetical protein
MSDALDALIDETPPRAGDELDALIASTPTPKGRGRAKLPAVGVGEALQQGAGQGVYGLGDELGAGLQGWLKFFGNLGKGPKEAMRLAERTELQALGENRALRDAARTQHPGAYYPAMIASAVATPGPKGLREAAFLPRLLSSAGAGFVQGGLFGAGASDAPTEAGRLKDAALPAIFGGGVGGLFTALGAPFRAAARGLIKPGQAAGALQKLGVDDLTLGQMAPQSALGSVEAAAAETPSLLGTGLRAQREGGLDSWRTAVLNAIRAPGKERLQPGTIPERIAEAQRGFDDIYGAIKAEPIPAEMGGVSMRKAMSDVFREITDDPLTYASQTARDDVSKYLQNQATILDKVPISPWPSSPLLPGGVVSGARALPATGAQAAAMVPAAQSALARQGLVVPPNQIIPPLRGSIPAEAVMKAREGIRAARREVLSGKNPDYTAAKFFGSAEEPLTEALGRFLPEGAGKALRKADEQYRKLKVVEDAVRSAGDSPQGLLPHQLSSAVRAAEERSSYARGGGGDLRQLAGLGREVFEAKTRGTGARLLGSIPIVDKLVQGGVYLANANPTLRRLALGQTWPQRIAQGAGGLANQLRLDDAAAKAMKLLPIDALLAQRRRRVIQDALSEEANNVP